MQEIWKGIPGYENTYQVSSIGQVKSLKKTFLSGTSYASSQTYDDKIMNPSLTKHGYFKIALSKDCVPKTFFVHRLVLMAFVGVNNLHTDHINRIRTDNRIENLRYVTRRQNQHNRSIIRDLPIGIRVRKDKFQARISINKKLISLGSFNTVEEAQKAYNNKLSTVKE